MLVDQRVRQLPLGAGELNAVSLDRSARRARLAELLPLGDEIGDPHGEDIHRGTVPTATEMGRTQRTKCWAAGHTPLIGMQASQVKPHREAR